MPAFAATHGRRRRGRRWHALATAGLLSTGCAGGATPEARPDSTGPAIASGANTTAGTTSASDSAAVPVTSAAAAPVPAEVSAAGGIVATPGRCADGVLDVVVHGGGEAFEVRLAATSLDPDVPIDGPPQRISVPAGAELDVALPIDAAVASCGVVILETVPLPVAASLEPAEFLPGNPAEIAAATGTTEFRLTACESAAAVVEVRNPTSAERAVSLAVTWLRSDGTTLTESAAYEFHPVAAGGSVTLTYTPRAALDAEPAGCRAEMAFDLPAEQAPAA